ncbi:hypothetical protein AB1N83_011670 [Pleurotus pulmonarius]
MAAGGNARDSVADSTVIVCNHFDDAVVYESQVFKSARALAPPAVVEQRTSPRRQRACSPASAIANRAASETSRRRSQRDVYVVSVD